VLTFTDISARQQAGSNASACPAAKRPTSACATSSTARRPSWRDARRWTWCSRWRTSASPTWWGGRPLLGWRCARPCRNWPGQACSSCSTAVYRSGEAHEGSNVRLLLRATQNGGLDDTILSTSSTWPLREPDGKVFGVLMHGDRRHRAHPRQPAGGRPARRARTGGVGRAARRRARRAGAHRRRRTPAAPRWPGSSSPVPATACAMPPRPACPTSCAPRSTCSASTPWAAAAAPRPGAPSRSTAPTSRPTRCGSAAARRPGRRPARLPRAADPGAVRRGAGRLHLVLPERFRFGAARPVGAGAAGQYRLAGDRPARRSAARQAAEERSHAILESMNDGFIAIDGSWRISYANAAAERITGLDRDPAWPATCSGTCSPTGRAARTNRPAAAAPLARTPARLEAFLAAWGGWYEINCFPMESRTAASPSISATRASAAWPKRACGAWRRWPSSRPTSSASSRPTPAAST
jgi:hypothetical protein